MKKRSIFTLLLGIIAGVLTLFIRPKKVYSPTHHHDPTTYPGTTLFIKPGDLLFSPIGKSESKYVGHVGIVNNDHKVIHSIPAGLMKDTVADYFRKFRLITIYSPENPTIGVKASDYLEYLYITYPRANYRFFTPLGSLNHEQYCTKIVWQSYYFGSGVNLGNHSIKSKAIHPHFLKDLRFLEQRS
ncbi:hypothetical protein [Halobacillus seohaensis]|uniref:Permuted papain-like amidase enzyme, YaeF/YiiX, C92 family n=1 Tax=Halobacillus seohaensis TaxID=447421 RepID=A0ABW2EDG5_9BACI